MTDIFQEVEEDLRRERLNQVWKRYGGVFLTVAVLAVAATGGFVFWRQYQQSQMEDAAQTYQAAIELARANDLDGALAAFGAIADNGRDGYRVLALFQQAGLLLARGDVRGALAVYDRVANSDADGRLKALARLRAAQALADVEEPDVLKNRVAPFAGDDNPWRFEAREIQAVADYRAGRQAEALAAYQALAADEKAPEGLRDRSRRMAAFVAGGAILPAPAAETPAAPTVEPAPAPAPEQPQ